MRKCVITVVGKDTVGIIAKILHSQHLKWLYDN